MQRDGREQERGTIPFAGQALGLALARMQVRQQLVQHHEERHADGESTRSGNPPDLPRFLRALDGGNQQRPHRRRYHYASRES
jgi:hypothetical protein